MCRWRHLKHEQVKCFPGRHFPASLYGILRGCGSLGNTKGKEGALSIGLVGHPGRSGKNQIRTQWWTGGGRNGLQFVSRFVFQFSGLRPKAKSPGEMQTLVLGSISGLLVLRPRNGPLVSTPALFSIPLGRGSLSSSPSSQGSAEHRSNGSHKQMEPKVVFYCQVNEGDSKPGLGPPERKRGRMARERTMRQGWGQQPWGLHRCSEDGLHLAGREENQRGDTAGQRAQRQGRQPSQDSVMGSEMLGLWVTSPQPLCHPRGHSPLLSLLCALRVPIPPPASHLTGAAGRPAHRGPCSTSWPLGTRCRSDSGSGGSAWRTGSE